MTDRHDDVLARLAESETRFQIMADTAPVLLWMSGRDGECTFFNQRWLDFTGRPMALELGNGWAEGIHAEDFQVAMDTYMQAFVARRPFQMEYRLRRADGAYRWLLDTGIPRFASGDRFEGYIGSCIDVTAYNEAREATAREAAERLRAVQREQEALARAEALRRADELKDQFLSNVSHELRTPINAILGFGSILEDGVAGTMTPMQRDYLHRMTRGADQVLALVNDLLDMSRIQTGNFTLEVSPTAPGEVVAEVLADLAGLAAPKGQAIVDEVPGDLPAVAADPARLRQVLRNLLSNALKFSPAGSTVVVRARAAGAVVRVEVVDAGEGISAADMPRLFHRFTQLHAGPTRPVRGTGLGLSISKALVEAQGGTIGATSEVGVGSTFWFELPVATGA